MLPPVVALRTEVSRATALLRSIRDPKAPALGEWNVAELAAHLAHAWTVLPALARQAVDGLPGRAGTSLIDELGELAGLTARMVAADPERDLGALADRIDARAADFLSEPPDGDRPCPWLVDGVTVERRHLVCHLLSETVVHSYDLARADGRRWRVDQASAAMIFRGFLLPVIRRLDSRSLLHQDRAARVRAAYDVHLPGGPPFRFVVDRGRLLAPERPEGRADTHIGADPAALLLVVWGRVPAWRPMATGRLVAWGRRPWLAPKLPSMLHTP